MRQSTLISVSISVSIAVLVAGVEISAQDKCTVKVPNGLAFAEFRGYEGWPVIAISATGGKIAVIVGNPAMIDAIRKACPATASLSQTAPRWRKFIGTRKNKRRTPVSQRCQVPSMTLISW